MRPRSRGTQPARCTSERIPSGPVFYCVLRAAKVLEQSVWVEEGTMEQTETQAEVQH